MRIAIAAMMHETNTFTRLRTSLADFRTARGHEVYEVTAWKGNVIDGIAETLRSSGAEIVPAYFARALPSGLVLRDTFKTIADAIVSGIAQAGTLDGICLALHGSMCAEDVDDPEGELLERIRAVVGPELPIVCALDMHATMTPRMIRYADGYAAYRTAPHIDEFETGAKAARMLTASVAGGQKLYTAWTPIPILIAGEQTETDVEPTRSLFAALAETDRTPGIQCASYVLGFPWADSVHAGAGALVTGFAGAETTLETASRRLADAFWAHRHNFTFTTEAMPLKEALAAAAEEREGPVIIADSGDNPTAGASQDSVLAVRALRDMKIAGALVAVIFDPDAVQACLAAGEGSKTDIVLGRPNPWAEGSDPLALSVEVMRTGRVRDVGYAAVRADGNVIVISDRRTAVYDPGILEALGLKPEAYPIVVVKSGYLSPEYKRLAKRAILALTPGDTCELLDQLPYRRVPRPIFPLDRM